jgi:hypothetical protein
MACPCGLNFEDVREHCLVNGFICPAPDAEGNPCGCRLADHPHRVVGESLCAVILYTPIYLCLLFQALGLELEGCQFVMVRILICVSY